MQQPIAKFLNISPSISNKAFAAHSADIIGDVRVGDFSSIWFNTVLRADINTIKIGKFTNIQDGTIMHVSDEFAVTIGDYVTVGHGVKLHACSIGSNALIGIGAIILDRVNISDGAQIAAGAVVTPRTDVPPSALMMGVPAKIVRFLTEKEVEDNVHWAKKYAKLIEEYKLKSNIKY